ncbi:MAG: hypothetical protein MI685_01260 [Chlorobiales bacterium]|nr:hypothetical protein [Chlorobiales bacterium]
MANVRNGLHEIWLISGPGLPSEALRTGGTTLNRIANDRVTLAIIAKAITGHASSYALKGRKEQLFLSPAGSACSAIELFRGK